MSLKVCIFNYMFSTAFLVSVESLIRGVIETKRRSKRDRRASARRVYPGLEINFFVREPAGD